MNLQLSLRINRRLVWQAHRTLLLLWMLLVMYSAVGVATPTQATTIRDPESYRYFPETGHTIRGAIKNFYDARGGTAIFGLPLTELIQEGDRQVQFFERACFELRPDQSVGLALIGAELGQIRPQEPFAWLAESPSPDREFFAESGHSLGGAFGWFWHSNGGVDVFGYPVSEEFTETLGGQPRLVQYFQRARFELAPDYTVQLGLIGWDYIQLRNVAPELLAPIQPILQLGRATTSFPAKSSSAHNILIAAKRFDGMVVRPGQVVSFLGTVGSVSARAGYIRSDAIVGGRITKDIGGGICQVSTTMYRAVFEAGLPVLERHGHSRVLAFFNDAPGLEAAVYTPDKDFRWRNDTPFDIVISVDTDLRAGTITVALSGQGDSRNTSVRGPSVNQRTKPGPATWQYDESLDYGETRQVSFRREGMVVRVTRVITNAEGAVMRRETIVTRYAPTPEVVLYGAGVTPPPGVVTN